MKIEDDVLVFDGAKDPEVADEASKFWPDPKFRPGVLARLTLRKDRKARHLALDFLFEPCPICGLVCVT